MSDERVVPDPERVFEFAAAIVVDGRTFDSITLREPTVSQTRSAKTQSKGDSFDFAMHLVALVANVPVSVIQSMKVSAFNSASEYLGSF